MIGNCPTETPHLKHASLLSLADVCVTPVKRSKDSVLTKMADVCSKMVDGEWRGGGGVNFPAPRFGSLAPVRAWQPSCRGRCFMFISWTIQSAD